jgi:pimeloyl-ACP methyl ester carboxylesterase
VLGTETWPWDAATPQGWIAFDVDDVAKATAELTAHGYQVLVVNTHDDWQAFQLPDSNVGYYVGMNKVHLPTGQTVAYDHYGHSEAEPVVLLHGLSSNRHVYDHLAIDLADQVTAGELQLFNLDLRGHGESSHAALEQYDAAGYASDVEAFMDRAVGRPAYVVAESLGGVIAVALAVRRPDLIRALFLEDPPLFLGDPARRAANPIATEFPAVIAAVREMQARAAPIGDYEDLMRDEAAPDELTALAHGMRSWDPWTMQAAIDGILWRDFDPVARLACPVTVLGADPAHGAAFMPGDATPLLAANPAARIVSVAGATHSVRSTASDAYRRELAIFLTPT